MTIEEIRDEAPLGATHYRINKGGIARYYRKDCNEDWIVYQDWKYPLIWKRTNLVDNIEPLN